MQKLSLKALADKALKDPSSLSAAEIRRLLAAGVRKLDREIKDTRQKSG